MPLPRPSTIDHNKVGANIAALMEEGYSRNQAIVMAFNAARAAYFKRYPQGLLPQWLAYPRDKRSAKYYAPNGAPMKERVENNPIEKSASEWAQTLADLREIKPRPLHKLYKSPTEEQFIKWSESMREWNKAYRHASKMQKAQLIIDNANYAALHRNPVRKPRDTERARRLLEGFTESPAQWSKIVDLPDFRVGLAPGKILGIIYETRIAGEHKRYIHQFRTIKSRPTLIVSHDGKSFRSYGGKFRFTDRGFVDDK